MKIVIAGHADVDNVWPILGPQFDAAARKYASDISAGELWQMARSGNAFLVVAVEGSNLLMGAVVRFDRLSSGSALRVLSLVGSERQKWQSEARDYLAAMARDNGACRIIAEGRDGWGVLFDAAKKTSSTYIMEI